MSHLDLQQRGLFAQSAVGLFTCRPCRVPVRLGHLASIGPCSRDDLKKVDISDLFLLVNWDGLDCQFSTVVLTMLPPHDVSSSNGAIILWSSVPICMATD